MIILHLGSSGLAEDHRRKQANNNISPLHWIQGALSVAKAGGRGITAEELFWRHLSTFLERENSIQQTGQLPWWYWLAI